MPIFTSMISIYLGVLPASLALSFLTVAYNEGMLYSHWVGKHIVSALLYAGAVIGALALLGQFYILHLLFDRSIDVMNY